MMYTMEQRESRRASQYKIRTNPLGFLLCLVLGLLITVLALGLAVSMQVSDAELLYEAVEDTLVGSSILSESEAYAFAEQTTAFLSGEQDEWITSITVYGFTIEVPETFTVHMEQVQEWVSYAALIPYAMGLTLLVLLLVTLLSAGFSRKRMLSPAGYYLGAAVPVVGIIAVITWASVDFQGFWKVLHTTLIPGGIFASNEPIMQLFPITLFQCYLEPVIFAFGCVMMAVLLVPLMLLAADKLIRRGKMKRMEY